jgi:hypothetical protein
MDEGKALKFVEEFKICKHPYDKGTHFHREFEKPFLHTVLF